MRSSESLANLALSLVKAQAEFPAVHKDAINPHFKSKFASLDAIMSAVVPVLNANHLAVMQGGGPGSDDSGIEVATRLLHASGEWVESTFRLPLAKSDPQGAGSAITYGKRYGLAAMLGIVADEDDDGEAATAPSRGQEATRAPAPPKPHTRVLPAKEVADSQKVLPSGCTTCGGEIWDNRLDKKNSKAPDWKCRDKECRDEKGYTTGGWCEKVEASEGGGPGHPDSFDDVPLALREEGDDLPF